MKETKSQSSKRRRRSCTAALPNQACWHIRRIGELCDQVRKYRKSNNHLRQETIIMQRKIDNQAETLAGMNLKATARNEELARMRKNATPAPQFTEAVGTTIPIPSAVIESKACNFPDCHCGECDWT
jgi:hypothetical protein